MKVSQAVDSTIHDSIIVAFRIPCNETLIIGIGDNNFKYYRYKYKEGNTAIKLPKNIKEFDFWINPEGIMPHSSDGRFYGIVCLDSHINIKIEENVNSIIIDLPALNNSFFEQYYVVDENGADPGIELSKTKTTNSNRVIPLPDPILEEIEIHKKYEDA